VSASRPSIVDTRRDQIFPVLDTDEIERARRFGDVRRFSTGEALASVGEIGEGLAIILEGQVEVYRYDARGERQHFYTFGQLGGRPSFGDAIAREPVKVLNFPPDRMRALLIGEAELGERLMRALIRADLVRNATAHPDPAKARPATGPRFRETLAGSARHLS
jgi:thioredoxin reductase (NADPH)